MEIKTTLGEIQSRTNDWDKYCDKKGWDKYSVAEGGGHVEVILTEQEAYDFGLLQKPPYWSDD